MNEVGKRVLVTGGAGFIAHHVIDNILKTTDWKIVCLDRLDISGNLNRLHDMLQDHDPKEVSQRLRIVFHDLKAEINPLISNMISLNFLVILFWSSSGMGWSADTATFTLGSLRRPALHT